jgi:hypothetical protein
MVGMNRASFPSLMTKGNKKMKMYGKKTKKKVVKKKGKKYGKK